MTQIPPITDHLPIAIRAFAGPRFSQPTAEKPKSRRTLAPASDWTLIFDTETTTDPGQALRFGTYQFRRREELDEAGIFYDPAGVTQSELERLADYAEAHGLELRTREAFVDEVFFARAFALRATIVGFNLPFDISRLAIQHGTARTPIDAENATMRGAFTFRLSEQKIYPNIRIKHLSRRSALISFAATMQQRASRGQRKRGLPTPVRRGHFIDVKTLAGALFARSFSLASLCRFLKVEHPKLDFEDFAAPISDAMIRYAVGDVQATWECYRASLTRFHQFGLTEAKPEKIYSEASIGKAYIRAMGIQPWRKVQPDCPRDLLAKIMGSYFGGRSEVRIRRELRQVMLCDFLSMYPTVCTLMGLWRFVVAQGMTWRDATGETRALLGAIDLAALQTQQTWRTLATLVRVAPEADIFPVRAAYQEGQNTIGANFLTSDIPLWFTLADCIAAKLLSGKTPRIIEAISFESGPTQPDLSPIDISGNPEYPVDPNTTDFFKRLIELRKSIQARMKSAPDDERARLDIDQNAVKIAANATSYGIYVEMNVDARRTASPVTVHSSTDLPFSFSTDKHENPGTYFHPLLATLITGAARLMLAITERLVTEQGLDWSFCDTDSMAIAKPEVMPTAEFAGRTQAVVAWFDALNPYDFEASILKIEDVNYSLLSKQLEPLYCWAVSSKRYALFNLDGEGLPIMRKVSAHGLGHLLPPYEEADAPAHFPVPDKSVLKDGTVRWHCDLWHQIVRAALAGQPDQVARDYHPALSHPARSRYGATSPDLLGWFKTYNAPRDYRDQVKPFGFMLAFSAGQHDAHEHIAPKGQRGRRKKAVPVKPIAPFENDAAKAVVMAFDRETGKSVRASALRAYAEALAQYHLSPEAKFANADFLDRGMTQRRHVYVASVQHIGKEAPDWERHAVLGMSGDAAIGYENQTDIVGAVAALVAEFGRAATARAFGLSVLQLEAVVTAGSKTRGKSMAHRLAIRLPKATQALRQSATRQKAELHRLLDMVKQFGLRATARRLGMDPSNLRRKLAAP
jgi:hypothetical protein